MLALAALSLLAAAFAGVAPVAGEGFAAISRGPALLRSGLAPPLPSPVSAAAAAAGSPAGGAPAARAVLAAGPLGFLGLAALGLACSASAAGRRLRRKPKKVTRFNADYIRVLLRRSEPEAPPYPEDQYPIWPPTTGEVFTMPGEPYGRKSVQEVPGMVLTPNQRISRNRYEEGIGLWMHKVGSQMMFEFDGYRYQSHPGTVLAIRRPGNVVVAKKWPEKHGYYALSIGYDRCKSTDIDPRFRGRFRSAEMPPMRKLKDTRMLGTEWGKYEVGQKLVASDIFKAGDIVDVWGITQEKGYLSAIKRFQHNRGPMTHGSKHHRRFGSVGASKHPGRVIPGYGKWGNKGGHAQTNRKLRIVSMEDGISDYGMPETIIHIRGTVPGQSDQSGMDYLGANVFMTRHNDYSDGRHRRDPVAMWLARAKDPDDDPYRPVTRDKPAKKFTTFKRDWGVDTRWVKHEIKKWWPEGFPGYNQIDDPFQDGYDPRLAMKAKDPFRSGAEGQGYPANPYGTIRPRVLRGRVNGVRPDRSSRGRKSKYGKAAKK